MESLPVVAFTTRGRNAIRSNSSSNRFERSWHSWQDLVNWIMYHSGFGQKDSFRQETRKSSQISYEELRKDGSVLWTCSVSTSNFLCKIVNWNLIAIVCSFNRCRHAVFSRFFGDEPPKCNKSCDYCSNPKATDDKVQSFFNSDLKSVPSLNMFGDDNDLYGGGKRGQEKYGDFWIHWNMFELCFVAEKRIIIEMQVERASRRIYRIN